MDMSKRRQKKKTIKEAIYSLPNYNSYLFKIQDQKNMKKDPLQPILWTNKKKNDNMRTHFSSVAGKNQVPNECRMEYTLLVMDDAIFKMLYIAVPYKSNVYDSQLA